MFRFESLEIWKASVEYGKECYKIANAFPKHETFSLSDQLRRSSVSISNNIAEGSIGSMMTFKKYLNIAVASALETVNIINFGSEVGYCKKETKDTMYKTAEILIRRIMSFSKSLTSSNKPLAISH